MTPVSSQLAESAGLRVAAGSSPPFIPFDEAERRTTAFTSAEYEEWSSPDMYYTHTRWRGPGTEK